MVGQEESGRDLAGLVVPLAGRLVAAGYRWEPYRLADADGKAVGAAGAYVGHLQAAGRAELTVRSYGMGLLRWFRLLWAPEVAWDRAGRSGARDLCRWLQLAGKPVRPHWRERRRPGTGAAVPVAGEVHAPSVRAHGETVLRGFYDFRLEAGTGPLVNPFPLDRSRRGGGAHAHRNPVEPYRLERSGMDRPAVPSRILAASRMRTSTRSSLPCTRTGTGPWWRSMSLPGRGRRSCCRRPAAAQIRDAS